MDVTGLKVVVVGLGSSGVSAARLLQTKRARVVANDASPRDALSAQARALETAGIELVSGEHPIALFAAADLVVMSPGVPDFPELSAATDRGCEVISEVELASRWLSAPIVLIGGTNGKSTTTELVGAMLKKAGKRVFVGGNLGVPLSEAVGQDFEALVVEISSFQAERSKCLHAKVHALLNVTEDHLDRHHTFEAYADAKGNPFVPMQPEDVAVVPHGDAVVAAQAARGKARIVTFGATPLAQVGVDGPDIVDRSTGSRYPISSLRLRGSHNLTNACAAIAVASSMGVSPDAILATLTSFEGLPHRTVFVAALDGVNFYDDSKGTNVGATVAALSGLPEPKVVLIAGGRDKHGDYGPLVDILRERGRAVILLGEAAERIQHAVGDVLPSRRVKSMQEAVVCAKELALPGDAVLLSPACSSLDMFRDYKARGEAFVHSVRELCAGVDA
ncbi:UDP-N-acetylmuramoylalanine--D-glutamate ligase [Chondromyces crocatus]|uniref:UDP-N-acetylmuramoylalanine--D-glutamate ligase n=1 Tax=Chondromyces crocatus TaxID=52 RepID=A0A0K1EN99_CHOCO|nr:UDP-N-acetylmuramoylalanine--D-glutamate ligase [Chondromyces crocatus]